MKLLVISHDIVGPAMAGPGIRYVEISAVLSQHVSVTLAAPVGSSAPADGIDIVLYSVGDWATLQAHASAADAVLLCGDTLASFPDLMDFDKPIIVDGYDPHTVESLFLNAHLPLEEQVSACRRRLQLMRMQCLAGDFFICASEAQRDWWLGHLESNGRINPYTVQQDSSLLSLIDLVPFGLPSQPFPLTPAVGSSDSTGTEDELGILWGGGLWEWLDPLTAVAAMPAILAKEPAARLLFPGTRHPNPAVPEMPKVKACEALVESLDLGRHVRFGTWVPRSDWIATLARARVGLSLHPNSIETHLAFRSRILDYIWAGLPMVVTRGDVTSKLVEAYGLGLVVDYGDAPGVAAAVTEVLASPKSAYADRFAVARAELTWDRAVAPLVKFCASPRRAPDKATSQAMVRNAVYEAQFQQLVEERDHLDALVRGYEAGRFIRTMNWLRRLLGRGVRR